MGSLYRTKLLGIGLTDRLTRITAAILILNYRLVLGIAFVYSKACAVSGLSHAPVRLIGSTVLKLLMNATIM